MPYAAPVDEMRFVLDAVAPLAGDAGEMAEAILGEAARFAGAELGAMRTRAVPAQDARWGEHYRISGQKIFITYGDHDLTDNIVHMVLARTPDAPPGSRGISLFLVPKFLPDGHGRPGERNDLRPLRLEEKLGIHASPTCVMSYGEGDRAIGWRIGEENRGL